MSWNLGNCMPQSIKNTYNEKNKSIKTPHLSFSQSSRINIEITQMVFKSSNGITLSTLLLYILIKFQIVYSDKLINGCLVFLERNSKTTACLF